MDEVEKPLNALTESVWATPVRSLVDLQERALIARRWLYVIGDDAWGERAIAHLIHAVLNFGGSLPALADGKASTVAPCREHFDYRAVTAEAEAWSGGDEDELTRLMERETQFARQIWNKPVETWFDVFLLAEVALYHENGILDSLDEKEPYHDELALAKLIKAAIMVGRRHYG